jgi:hypothetical protein
VRLGTKPSWDCGLGDPTTWDAESLKQTSGLGCFRSQAPQDAREAQHGMSCRICLPECSPRLSHPSLCRRLQPADSDDSPRNTGKGGCRGDAVPGWPAHLPHGTGFCHHPRCGHFGRRRRGCVRREHRPWPQPSLPRFTSDEDDKQSGRLIPVEEVWPRVSVVRTHWTAVVANEVEERWKGVMADDCSAPN